MKRQYFVRLGFLVNAMSHVKVKLQVYYSSKFLNVRLQIMIFCYHFAYFIFHSYVTKHATLLFCIDLILFVCKFKLYVSFSSAYSVNRTKLHISSCFFVGLAIWFFLIQ